MKASATLTFLSLVGNTLAIKCWYSSGSNPLYAYDFPFLGIKLTDFPESDMCLRTDICGRPGGCNMPEVSDRYSYMPGNKSSLANVSYILECFTDGCNTPLPEVLPDGRVIADIRKVSDAKAGVPQSILDILKTKTTYYYTATGGPTPSSTSPATVTPTSSAVPGTPVTVPPTMTSSPETTCTTSSTVSPTKTETKTPEPTKPVIVSGGESVKAAASILTFLAALAFF